MGLNMERKRMNRKYIEDSNRLIGCRVNSHFPFQHLIAIDAGLGMSFIWTFVIG